MPRILATHAALPAHRYRQQQLTDAFAELSGLDPARQRLLRRLHGNAGVEHRHLALPIEQYAELTDFGAANDAYIDAAGRLGREALESGLKAAGVTADQVDLLVWASTTGLAVPSLDARIAEAAELRPDVKRLPLSGLGCVAGAAGVSRVNDYLLGHPDQVAVLLSVELCSITLQHRDTSTANLVATGLFGDGAGAVVMAGDDHPAVGDPMAAGGVSVLASRSRLYPGTPRAMGWDVSAEGLRIVLGAEIPDLIRTEIGADVEGFLADNGLLHSDLGWWVCHPGGPKVLQAVQDALGLKSGEVDLTWQSLAEIGNVSSASVLHVLERTCRDRPPEPGSYGLMMAMGPGFAVELVLLQAP